MNQQTFDVIIVGAGIAGSALAVALQESRYRIAVIEVLGLQTDWPENGQGVADFDPRVSALTIASQEFLQQLGTWPLIAGQRVCAYRHMHVWDGDGTAAIDFDADDINAACLGHIVENRLTVTALHQRIRKAGKVQVFAGSKVTDLFEQDDRRGITLADGQQLLAPLLVAADGAHSFVRRQAGFELREWQYGHSAIVTTVKMTEPHQLTAWQRFTPEGPIAFLPLPTTDDQQQMCSIVWSALSQYAENLMGLDDEAFAEQLARAFEYRLGEVEAVGPRFSFPLTQRHAKDYIQPGIALVADAAHTIHPLAGQGINIGLKDVRALAEELLRAEQRGIAPGHLSVLRRYQRQRKADNLAMMASMEGFKRLFAETALPVRWLRNAGMRNLNNLPIVKNQIIKMAVGV
jgi:2-octaprenylphenol hydroxylase